MTGDSNAEALGYDNLYELALPPWAVSVVARADLTDLRAKVVEHCLRVAFPACRQDETFVESLSTSVHENTQALRDVLCGRLALARVPLERRLAFAALQAELRIPQTALQRSYRISFFTQWEEWARLLSEEVARADVPREEALAALSSLTCIVQAYSDRVVSYVVGSFARAEDAFNRSRAHIRQRLIRELLDGTEEALSPSDILTIDYSFESWHVTVLLPATPEATATQLVVGLRGAVRPQASLVWSEGLVGSVICLGSVAGWNSTRRAILRETLEALGIVASLSDPHRGIPGFRKAYEQSRQVERVRTALAQDDVYPVLEYDEVRLDILLLQNPQLASEFLTDVLGPLTANTVEAARLRATLEASFRLGSHVAAAEHLKLHEHTVRNRLQRAEELIGSSLRDRRTEILVALRLAKLIDLP
ncbi:helix-turn-helix domain-containing protein [Jatrophihabitans telluris]|uniref:Helix-turn-helix domain-containing protein n=1 Tax=Jatrophihabitans telluris TaxID=2038343 RepID=A0ABY4QZR8_9ACTN|nr:helix-turn-helix domain-containing protein [Jatrophihabitans telluris]UQX88975.1 helix-turn-helix domain-containing protein [Jatrophihabitans telluris]